MADEATGVILRRTDLGPPKGYTQQEAGLSNCGFDVDEGCEEGLRAGKTFACYAGWNFYGFVWLDAGGSFSCQVWCYGSPVATVVAPTLDALMHAVSDEWGYE